MVQHVAVIHMVSLLLSGEQCIVVLPFSLFFFRVSDKTRNKCINDSFIQIGIVKVEISEIK